MRKNKFMFMALIFLVSLLCISTVSAADDAASDIVADTSDVTVMEESIDDAVLEDSQSEENVLSNEEDGSEPLNDPPVEKNFTALYEDINNGEDTVELNADYLYSGEEYSGMGISINRNVSIYGNGHYIDGNGSSRIFRIYSSNVTFHDIVFKNAYDDSSYAAGAAIDGSATAINCTFIGNRVDGSTSKGAAMSEGTAINCTFMNNTAKFGGAVYGTTAINCTFIHNEAEYWGGAARDCNAINCSFIANNAGNSGGATYEGVSTNCTYLSNTADSQKDYDGTSIHDCIFSDSADLSVADFSTILYSCEKQMISLIANGGKILNVPVTVKITKDGEEIGNYTGLSGDGWIVNLGPGTYDAEFSVDYGNVKKATCEIVIGSETSFLYLDYLINKKYLDNSTIYLDKDYEYTGDSDSTFKGGIRIVRNLTIDGNNHKINGNNVARIFRVSSGAVVTFKNIVFNNGRVKDNGYGGAIWAEDSTVKAIKCNFSSNYAHNGGAIANGDAEDCYFQFNRAWIRDDYYYGGSYGGAIYKGNAINCVFYDNAANFFDGGAIYYGDATNCTFISNEAVNGGAIYGGNAIGCIFEGNRASNGGGAIAKGDATDCIFEGNNASNGGGAICVGNAICCIFNNNTATNIGGAIYDGDAINCSFTGNNVINGNGTAMISDEETPCHAVNCIFTSNNADKKVISNGIADSCIFNGGDAPSDDLVVYQPDISVNNFTSNYKDGSVLVVNITSRSGVPIADAKIKVDVYTKSGTFVGTYNTTNSGWKVPLNAGSYVATFNATDYDNVTAQGSIVVNKIKTAVTSKAVSTVYNNNKYLIITLKDSKGNILSGQTVTVKLASAKKYKTNKNGQIKINIAKLVPKTYNAKISFAGNTNYAASSKSVKVTVKKAKPKMTAKKKTFKLKVKVKKYTVVLKTNKNKVMKKVKLTLKVKGKTYKATTNKKGKATFKITNLKKKGRSTAVIKFAGNKYYTKLTKKPKITVKG